MTTWSPSTTWLTGRIAGNARWVKTSRPTETLRSNWSDSSRGSAFSLRVLAMLIAPPAWPHRCPAAPRPVTWPPTALYLLAVQARQVEAKVPSQTARRPGTRPGDRARLRTGRARGLPLAGRPSPAGLGLVTAAVPGAGRGRG